MILVTGAGRCGSSLMMQTLELLDIPLLGPHGSSNTLVWDIDDKDYHDRFNELNPKGLYELNYHLLIDYCRNGWTPKEFHKGKAVKLLSPLVACIEPTMIEKIIVCVRRDRDKQAESMHKLAELELEASELLDWKNIYTKSYEGLSVSDIKETQDDILDTIYHMVGKNNIPTLQVTYEDMLESPEEEIDCIACFVGSNADIGNAVTNVIRK